MLRRITSVIAGIFIACFMLSVTVHAETPAPPPPANGYYVRDDTGTLSADEVGKLNDKIGDYRKRTSVQLAVLMIAKLPPDEYLEGYSIKVARTWGVGEKAKNNGALLFIVKDEHKLRIEVGTGLEGDLTDARSSRIIRDRIAPQFKAGNFYQGIYDGLDGMSLAIGNSDDPLLSNAQSSNMSSKDIEGLVEFAIYAGIFILSWLSAILGRTKSWWTGGIIGAVVGGVGTYLITSGSAFWTILWTIILTLFGLLFDFVVSKNYRNAKGSGSSPSWWAGGGSFGGGGGGGGFSGGSFGGGGSSGSW